MTPITKTVQRVTLETYGYGKGTRKLVVAFERGDLISIREFGCRTKDVARIHDVLWWMKRSKARENSHGEIARAQGGESGSSQSKSSTRRDQRLFREQ
jgi:hypothetical protein